MSHRALAQSLIVALSVLFAAGANAGDLNPPTGPVQPTNRVQINAQSATTPYIIDQPGSYVLTSDITGVAGQHGLVVDANDVSIDLNGFTLRGVAGSLSGVFVASGRSNVVIENGTVTGWGSRGVDADNTIGLRLRSVRVMNNTGVGAIVGADSLVQECVVESNGLGIGNTGLVVRDRSVVQNCLVNNNGFNGIAVGADSLVVGCTANGNPVGIFAPDNAVVRDCVTNGNAEYGVYANGDALFENVSANNNGMWGFFLAGSNARLNRCSANFNGGAAAVAATDAPVSRGVIGADDTGASIVLSEPLRSPRGGVAHDGVRGSNVGGVVVFGSNCAVENTTASNNIGDGVLISFSSVGTTVDNCVVSDNSGVGVVANSCRVQNSTIKTNSLGGVHAGSLVNIVHNTLMSNGGGTVVSGSDTRVYGNRLVFESLLLTDETQYCLVVKNELAGVIIIDEGANNRVAPAVSMVDGATGAWVNIAF